MHAAENLRDTTDGHLKRFALMVTGPDRADDGDRLATVHAAHERVPLGEAAPFGYNAIVLPPEDRPPPEAPADLTGLAAYAVQWPTAPRRYSVARSPHPGQGCPAWCRLPGPPAGLALGSHRPCPPSTLLRTFATARPSPRPPYLSVLSLSLSLSLALSLSLSLCACVSPAARR